jgi:CelD/BcsL family acetyltransferase involved in cellulose biosynthesis
MPEAADLIRLRKVPIDLDGRPNPLALLDTGGPCSLNGNLATTGEDYDAWRYTLQKVVRTELQRSWRVFTRDPAASFAIVTDINEALRILAATEVELFAGPIGHPAHHGGPAQGRRARVRLSVGNYAYKRRFGVTRLRSTSALP